MFEHTATEAHATRARRDGQRGAMSLVSTGCRFREEAGQFRKPGGSTEYGAGQKQRGA